MNWSGCTDCEYHVFRRLSGVSSSFFRVDDPDGNLGVPGLSGTTYLDSDVSAVGQYEYLVLARSSGGSFSPPSNPVTAPVGVCGDADNSGEISIGDAVFLINYIFAGGPPPVNFTLADADCSQDVSIGDAVYTINFIFAGGPPPCAACL